MRIHKDTRFLVAVGRSHPRAYDSRAAVARDAEVLRMPRRRLHNLTYRHPFLRLYVTDASSDVLVAPATTARLTLQGPDLCMSLLVTVNVGQMRITAREGGS
jgi:hypothetical protein